MFNYGASIARGIQLINLIYALLVVVFDGLWRVQWLALPKWMTLKLIERSNVMEREAG